MAIRPEQVCHLVDTDAPRMVPTDEPMMLRSNAHRQDDPYLRRQRVIRFCQAAVVPFCWFGSTGTVAEIALTPVPAVVRRRNRR